MLKNFSGKKLWLLIISLLTTFNLYAKQHEHSAGKIFLQTEELKQKGAFAEEIRPFELIAAKGSENFRNELKEFSLLKTASAFRDVINRQPESMKLILPVNDGAITLLLYKTDISQNGFTLLTSDGKTEQPVKVTHYRGIIENDPHSVVSFSFSQNETMGLISDYSGNRVFGPVENDAEGRFVLYHDKDLTKPAHFECGTSQVAPGVKPAPGNNLSTTTVNCVNWYWETDYDVYVNKGNTANVTAYVQGIFNQVSTLYANDGMNITLQTLFVWNTSDPYTGPSTLDYLNQFGVYRTTFAGDLANLIGFNGGGGIAWIDGLCSSPNKYKQAYAGISSTYNTVPTYSWTVEVVAHEEGHLLGSRHTHDCVWNGNNTPIDGCGPAAGYSSGSCTAGPIPVKGTIMSYCHLSPNPGINLALGFGTQPTALMTNNINTSSCLNACSGCPTPAQPVTIAGNTSACSNAAVTYSISAVSGATSYSWTLPSGWTGSSTGTTINVTTGSNGGTVSVTANNSCGSSPAATKSVSINGSSPAMPDVIVKTGGIPKVCPGDVRTYTVPSLAGITYQWTPPSGAVIVSGQGTNSVQLSFTSNFSSSGTLSVVAQNNCGQSAARTLAITRNTPGTPWALTGNKTGVCGLTNVIYSVHAVNGMSYNWSVPSGATIISGQGSNTISVNYPSNAVSGYVKVNAYNACGNSGYRQIKIKSVPDKPSGITGNANVCPNTTAVPYSISPVLFATSYTWTAPFGAHISDGITISQGNTLSTTSTSVTIDFAGLNSTSSVRVKANNACGSGQNALLALNTQGCRVSDLQAEGIKVFPNPATSEINISLSSERDYNGELRLTDISGKTVLREKVVLTSGFNLIQRATNEFARGLYIIEIETTDKIIREKIELQ